MKTLLLTGATGFIGSQTLPCLIDAGYEIHAACVEESPRLQAAVECHQVDLFDTGAVNRLLATVQPTHLMHFAWFTKPGELYSSLENFNWVTAGIELFDAFTRHGGRRALFAGSCAEYDWSQRILSENQTPLRPVSMYGLAKRSLFQILESMAGDRGISLAWGRIFFAYGPREHPNRLVAYIIRSLLNDEPARCSEGRQVRDFLHSADIGGAMAALLDSAVEGAVNIGSGQGVPVRELAVQIGALLGRPDLVELGALPIGKKEPPELVADVTRLREEVKWRPRFNLERGLGDTIVWWRDHMG